MELIQAVTFLNQNQSVFKRKILFCEERRKNRCNFKDDVGLGIRGEILNIEGNMN